jgi:hypothetical protein
MLNQVSNIHHHLIVIKEKKLTFKPLDPKQQQKHCSLDPKQQQIHCSLDPKQQQKHC